MGVCAADGRADAGVGEPLEVPRRGRHHRVVQLVPRRRHLPQGERLFSEKITLLGVRDFRNEKIETN